MWAARSVLSLDQLGRFESRLSPKTVDFLNPPAGPKTIHFWAPTFKWGLVIAGIADIARPAHKLSTRQSVALAATGTIWARYSLVINPINYNLFGVNLFVAITGYSQLFRIWRYKQSLTSSPAEQTVQSLPATQTLEPSPAVQSSPAEETETKETH